MALRYAYLFLSVLSWAYVAPQCTAEAARAKPVAHTIEPPQEILAIPTADGLQLAGLLTLPPGGAATGAPIVILIPDGPGGNPVKATDPARAMARGLAREGYGVLTLETRQTTQYPFTRFDDAFGDVKAAVDLAAARGFATTILGGAGLGSLLAARYAAHADDARVKAVLIYGPSVDLAASWRAKVGDEEYARTVERATKAATDNTKANFIDLGDGVIFTPAVFLDWYGPTARTSLTAALGALDRPVLLAAGSDDATAPPARLQRLTQADVNKKAVIKTYRGAGHDLYRVRDQVVTDTVAWLGENGLAPPPHVVTTIVDAHAADGTALSGVLYTPASTPPPNGVRHQTFMLVPGLSGDTMRGLTHALALRFAQHGDIALVVRTRESGYRNTLDGKLEDIPKDLAAWSDFLAARGASRIIGIGHGIGGLWLSVYLSKSQDKRFRGAVYLSPPRDLPDLAKRAMGDDAYNRAISEAESASKSGKGESALITAPFPQATYEEDPRQPMFLQPAGAGYLNAYADAFLSYWAPGSLSVHRDRIADVKIPIFALGGSRDYMMQGAWLLQFIKAAAGPATSIFYGGPSGAPASFDGFEGKVADDVLGWAQRLP